MKIWAFYLKPDKATKHVPIEEVVAQYKYPMYAWSAVKAEVELFRLTRKPGYFLEKSWKIPDDEFDIWAIANRGTGMNFTSFESYRYRNTDHQEVYYVKIVTTENEANFVVDTIDDGSILNRIPGWTSTDLYQLKIQRSLEKLQYDKAARFALSLNTGTVPGYVMETDPALLDGEFLYDIMDHDISFSYDQFGVFMLLYGQSLSDTFTDYLEFSMQPFINVTGGYF